MQEHDIIIVGAGLAGSMAATMLARNGHSVVVVDPNEVYPADFRCEKIDPPKIEILRRAGLIDAVVAQATLDRSEWIARLGLLVEKKVSCQYGIEYGHFVNTLRSQIPRDVEFVRGKVTAIANTDDKQRVMLASGRILAGRLVVLASGLGSGLRQSLGMDREDLSPCHSVSIAFDIEPDSERGFPFRAMTYYGEHPRSRVSYVTLFPIENRMRANLFVYRSLDDPWLREFRASPDATLNAVLPRLARLTGPARVTGAVKARPVDLYTTRGYRQPGVVLLGDAFGTACPAAGTGAYKAMVDTERLCHGYASAWLATPGMGIEKVNAFYDDAAKRRSDRNSLALAWSAKAMAVDERLSWWIMRLATVPFGWTRWFANTVRSLVSPRQGGTAHTATHAVAGLEWMAEISHYLGRWPDLKAAVSRAAHRLYDRHVVEVGEPVLHGREQRPLAVAAHGNGGHRSAIAIGQYPEQVIFERPERGGEDGNAREVRPRQGGDTAGAVVERDELVVMRDPQAGRGPRLLPGGEVGPPS